MPPTPAPTQAAPTVTPATPAASEAPDGSMAASIRLVAGLTLLSRLAGAGRDAMTAHIFGNTALGSAFRAAYAVPNLFRRLFGEGALSAAFLPQYTSLVRDDPAAANRLASAVIAALTLVTGALTLLIEVVLLAWLMLGHHDEERRLSFQLIALMLPMMPLVCMTAILGGMLQVHGRFGPPTAAPILLNVFQIAAGVVPFIDPSIGQRPMAFVIGGAALLASVAQVVWSLSALRRHAVWTKSIAAAGPHARVVLRRFLPAMLGLGTLQLNTMVDTLIAMWPVWVGPTVLGREVPLDASSNAIISYIQALYQFPLGVFGLAVATVVFPALSRASNDAEGFAATLRRGLRLSLFIGLPATVGLVLVRHDLVYSVYSGSRYGFDAEGVARGAAALTGFSIGVWAYSLNHVFTRAFYAKGDTVTPMRLAIAMVGLNFSLNISLIWFVREAGLAWATGITAIVQCVFIAGLCRAKLGVRSVDPATLAAFLRIVAASALMGLLVWLVREFFPAFEGWKGHALRLMACFAAGAAAYTAASVLLRLPELRWLLARGPAARTPAPLE